MPTLDALGRVVLSASQVDTFKDCQRKWAWRYLEGIKDAPHASARLGQRCHKVAEDWLISAIQPDGLEVMTLPTKREGQTKDYYPGQIITAGLHLLPAPGVAEVEGRFTFYTGESAWQGYRDALYLLNPRTGEAFAPDPIVAQDPELIPVVLDHKTTSDFKWMKTEEDLRTDVQANLYAAKTMEDFQTPKVMGRWIYYRTKGQPEARPVELTFTGEAVAEQIGKIDAMARNIHHLYHVRPKALDLPPTVDTCEKYGGCPHKGRCNLGIVERMESIMATESIQEMMERKRREREALASGGAPPPPHQAPPAPPQAPAAPPVWTPQAGDQLQAAPNQAQSDYLRSLGLTAEQTAGGWTVVALSTAGPTDQTADHAHPAPSQDGSTYWKPGDPMNAAQKYIQGQGKPLSVIATAADNPPPLNVALSYDAGGTTEAGTINPPEAPAAAPPNPDHMPPVEEEGDDTPADDLDTMERDQLKVMAMGLGIVDSSCRYGDKRLRDEIRAHRKANPPQAPAAPTQEAPPAPPSSPGAPPPPPAAPPAPPAPPPQEASVEATGSLTWERHFQFSHLPEELQTVSRPFAELAEMLLLLPAGPERDQSLLRLVEAKDWAVRSMLPGA